jgi:Sulfotransferase family
VTPGPLITTRRLLRLAVQLLPDSGALVRPVFIIGCGRSGTTVLGEVLGRHPQLAYLNEPRDIWLYEPRCDIWSARARARGGRLRLVAANVESAAATRIARAFAAEVRLQRAERLVEKLPINAFRIGWLAGMFPDALFVHLIRNGLEVAASIARQAQRAAWFGVEDYKWRLLAEHAGERGEAGLVGLSSDGLRRGLLEWRLSVATALEDLAKLPAQRWIEVRYERLVDQPAEVCERLEDFVGVHHEPAVAALARARLRRRSPPPDPAAFPPAAREIAGELLAGLGYLSSTRDVRRHA